MKNNQVKIETYKGIDLFYDKDHGRIMFNFEGSEREVTYVFEAQRIIDEPRWEDCKLEGYFIDGVFHDYIGLAKASRKDIKSGNPDWLLKGRYDMEYKKVNGQPKVYPKNEINNEVYARYKKQREVVQKEERTLKNIIDELNPL